MQQEKDSLCWNVESLVRNLPDDQESAGYCCKTAFTVDSKSLPEEDAFK